MAKIPENIMTEIKETAKEYMLAVKGHHLTENDLMVAENLIMFGYIKAINEHGQLNESLLKLSKA